MVGDKDEEMERACIMEVLIFIVIHIGEDREIKSEKHPFILGGKKVFSDLNKRTLVE